MAPLRIIGPASIEVWISSPVRSRKPVLMKTTRSAAALMQALRLTRGAPFLVHDADLQGGLRQPEHVLDAAEQLAGERDLVGTVHLGLDDVDRAGAAVEQRSVGSSLGLQSVHRDEAGEQRVLDALGHFLAVGVGDRVVGHQVTDVAHEQQAAPGQGELVRRRGSVKVRSSLSTRVNVLPPLLTSSVRSPRFRPSQLR